MTPIPSGGLGLKASDYAILIAAMVSVLVLLTWWLVLLTSFSRNKVLLPNDLAIPVLS